MSETNELKVLLIEDNPGDARIIIDMLSQENVSIKFSRFAIQDSLYTVDHVISLKQARGRLVDMDIDVVLLSLSLPEGAGMRALETLDAFNLSAPIVALTGFNDPIGVGIDAVTHGAQDYLSKSELDRKFLIRTLRYAIERRKVNRELNESQRRFKDLATLLPQTVFEVNAMGTITYANSFGLDFFGYTEDELDSGIHVLSLFSETEHERINDSFNKLMEGEVPSSGNEYEMLKRNGEKRSILVYTTPVVTDGFVSGLRGIGIDISDRKLMENELKRYNERLEGEVRQRTQEAIQSEKMASLGQLVAGVAHEVNNPLTFIKSNSQFVFEDLEDIKVKRELNDEDRELLADIQDLMKKNIDGINRIATITKTLKRFAKPEKEGKVPADINEGIRDTLVIVHNQLKNRIEIHEEYGDIPQVVCNIGQLNQVFMNLIINASQAMNEGDIWLRTWSKGGDVFVSVKDNGEGIPEEKLKAIFDPFFTSKAQGTGLGLSITYRIIEEHGGDIRVESNIGQGTEFVVRIPLGKRV